jgi:D-xylose transport system permease protein
MTDLGGRAADQGQQSTVTSGRTGLLGGKLDQLRRELPERVRPITLVLILVAIWLIFQVLTQGLFLSPRNITTLTIQVAITAMLAAGIVMVMVPGHIDLSVGASVAFCAMFAAWLLDPVRGIADVLELSPAAVIILTVVGGLCIGAWQGLWVAWMGLPAFIVTLASLLALRGLALTITEGSTLSPGGKLAFIAGDFLPAWVGAILLAATAAMVTGLRLIDYRARQQAGLRVSFVSAVAGPMLLVTLLSLAALAVAISYRGVPVPVVVTGAVVAGVAFVLYRTRLGRELYAIGGNGEAARYTGINIRQRVFTAFLVMGLLYGVGGLMLLSRVGVALPTAASGLELVVIASAVIGGTSLFGGVGSPLGAVIGALLLETLNNGMGLLNISTSYQLVSNGLVLLLAVYLDLRGRRAA